MDLENFKIFEKKKYSVYGVGKLQNFRKKKFPIASLHYIRIKILYNKYTRGYIRSNFSTFRINLLTKCYGIKPSLLYLQFF